MTFRDYFEILCNFWWISDDLFDDSGACRVIFDEFTDRAVAARCRLGPSFLGSSGSVRGAFCVSFVTFW